MPGVPSGRGCEACRKQKKRCDQSLPSCSRCTRLRINCKGVGERRFKFVIDGPSSRTSSKSQSPPEGQSASRSQKSLTNSVSRTPSNKTTTLTVALIEKVNESCDLRYHLSWTYGNFLEDIPRRIGSNEALDASVTALVYAHSQLGSQWTALTASESLSRYNQALRALRITLDHPQKARQAETLCACYLLLICQSFVDAHVDCWSTHTEGAAQMLKARGYFYTNNKFEQKLLLSLRGPVLMEAILIDKISFSREEWMDLVENDLDTSTPEGRMMRCWAQMPDLMRRGKLALDGFEDLDGMVSEGIHQYRTLMSLLREFKDRYDQYKVQPTQVSRAISPEKIYNIYQRMYGLCLALCLVSNCIVKALDSSSTDLEADSDEMCRQVLIIADEAARYRPLGASYVTLCLIAGWCSSMDVAMKKTLEEILIDYLRDWPRRINAATLIESLGHTSRRLRLLDSQRVRAF